jgi:DNA-binding response OmpR family regulator
MNLASGSPSGAAVLVVEDDESARAMITQYLSRHGLATMGARTGLEAWMLLQQHRFDVVVLDLMLPGMSGPELLSRIRGAQEPVRSISVVVASAASDNDRQIECLRLGADDFVAKPYSLGLLQARVQAQFRRRTTFRSGADVGPDERYRREGVLVDTVVPGWLGRHRQTGQTVEVRSATVDEQQLAWFKSWWRQLSSPQPLGLVRVLDAGVPHDGLCWWVTEALPGLPVNDHWGHATDRGIAVVVSLLRLLQQLEERGWLPHRLDERDVHVDDKGEVWLRDPGLDRFHEEATTTGGEIKQVVALARHLCVAEELLAPLGDAATLRAAEQRFRAAVRGR